MPYLPETKTPDYKIAQEAVDTYLKSGGKYFETGYNYMNFQSEDIARKCLVEKYHREDFFLCAKMPIRFKVVFEQGYQAVFEQQLKKCGVEYFDVYLLHNLGGKLYEKVKKTGGFDFLKKIKREGKAKLVGFSFHDKAEALEYILSQEPDIDIVQLQINYQDWDSSAIQSRLCYEVATKYNKTVTVMEPLKGGNLVNRLPEGAEELISQSFYTPASLGLKWVASLDNTAVVLSGMSAPEQTIANAEALMMPCQLEEDGYKLIADVLQLFEKKKLVDCTNCGYCLDVCPKNIPINDIFQLLNNESENGKRINRNANMFYQRNVSGKGKASDCIKCGKCEDICSQRLQIRRELENAVKIFE